MAGGVLRQGRRGAEPAKLRWRTRLRSRWVRRGFSLLIFLAVLEFLVLPQIAGTRAALHSLSQVRTSYLLFGALLEAASLATYSLLTRSVRPGPRPSYSWLLRTDLTSLGVSHVAPGGAATASTLRYHLLREGGVPAEDAVVGSAVQGVGSAVVLVGILWLSLVGSIPFSAGHLSYVVAAAVGAVVIVAITLLLLRFPASRVHSPADLSRVTRHLPNKIRPAVTRALSSAGRQFGQLLGDRAGLARAAGWAAGNWLLDAASLGVFMAAYGYHVNPVELLLAYALANVAAAIPVSPGGLGVMEAILIPTLVGFGAPRAAAVLGIVSWRLFQFWVPIPVSAVSYVSLRAQGWWEGSAHQRSGRDWAAISAGRRA